MNFSDISIINFPFFTVFSAQTIDKVKKILHNKIGGIKMNNALLIRMKLGNVSIRASIDERSDAEHNSTSPKTLGEDTELHYHNSHELFFSTGGELVIKDSLGTHSYTNAAVFIPPFYEHTALVDPSRFRILFDMVELKSRQSHEADKFFAAMDKGGITEVPAGEAAALYIEKIKHSIKYGGAMMREELSALLKLLFITLISTVGGNKKTNIGIENYTVVIDECISEHLSEDVTIGFVAEKLHLSYRQTARIIKASYKEPLHRIILKKRLAAARRMLRSTDEPISVVASSSGFANESYFYRLFLREVGTTPKKYREDSLKTGRISD